MPRSSAPSSSSNPRNNRAVPLFSNVIELTDSEDDEGMLHPKKSSRNIAKAGLMTKPLAASTSTENMPSSSTQRDDDFPLSISSDEENIPLPRTLDHSVHEEWPLALLTTKLNEVRDPLQLENQLEAIPATPSGLLAQILELVPDVQPEYATELITQQSATRPAEVVEAVIHALFSAPYPKADKKGKRKSSSGDEGQRKRPRVDRPDYTKVDRDFKGGIHYIDLSIEQLMVDFPDIPKPHIRKILHVNKSLYVPVHLHFLEEKKRGPPFPYTPKKTTYKPPKGKRRALEDAEFERERAWLLEKLKEDQVKKDTSVAEQINEQEYEDCGDGIECGCCFSSYPFDKMIQCPEAHLFCSDCMNSYVENLLGSHNSEIICMDQSGCKLSFPVSELRRFLPDKLLDLYERVKQRKEIELAGLDGLEECPFCDYKCVIENPDEKLFRCGNEEVCGAVTCRQCKKMDHLPKSCKEMEQDRVLDGRHLIEEAMARALMRSCPRCNKSFVKEDGCNKMSCPHCRALSCYVCRQMITGYDHFNQAAPGAPGSSANSNKCPLWEPVENRHAAEVKAAAEKAIEEYKRDNPDISETDIGVDISNPPPRPSKSQIDALGYGLPGMPRQNPYYAAANLPPLNAYFGRPAHQLPNIFNLPVLDPLVVAPPPPPAPAVPLPPPRARRVRRR